MSFLPPLPQGPHTRNFAFASRGIGRCGSRWYVDLMEKAPSLTTTLQANGTL